MDGRLLLVLHGDRDSLIPLPDTRLFVDRLREVSRQPVFYAELKGAQHGFDIFPSVRTARVVEGVERFLTTLWHRRADPPLQLPAGQPDGADEDEEQDAVTTP